VFDHLQIYETRERWIVGGADALLRGCAAVSRWRSPPIETPRRILLLRLERIGDLVMTLGAIADVRSRAPNAGIHLVVGSWNEALARLIPGIDVLETVDVPWLTRSGAGASLRGLVARSWAWRARRFDVGINFEPDIRSNLLLALSGARRRVGFWTGGGGAFLTDALAYTPRSHTLTNALRLVDAAVPAADANAIATPAPPFPRLKIPDDVRERAREILAGAGAGRILVGLHASGGRRIKQWHPGRFAHVATRLAREHDARIVFTGTPDDRPLVDRVKAALPPDVWALDVTHSMDLPSLAGLLEHLNLFITSDTGPMHLAAAVGTPIVALFGPSDPSRYAPLTDRARIVTIDLWCRPCNRVRRPPARCVGRVPDCLSGIDVDRVCVAANNLLEEVRLRTRSPDP
jgi:ADP-heptose:LPS heptosyltransferase